MFKSYDKFQLDQLLILTLSSILLCTLWVNLADADYVIVADEGESRIIRFKCGLHLTRATAVYFNKLIPYNWKLLYLLDEKKKSNEQLGHLIGRARLYFDSGQMILHISSLQISDTGYYEFDGNCIDTILLKVQGKPVLKINGVNLRYKATFLNDQTVNVSCQKEGLTSSIMKIKLNEELPGTIEYLESKTNTAHLNIVSLKASHKFTVDDIDKTLICFSDDSKLERKVHIDVTVKAKVSISKVNLVKVGEEVTLRCTSIGRPGTEMYWLKADTKLSGVNTKPTPDGKLMKIENDLQFIPSIEDNTKNLTCVALDGNIKDEMTLNVIYPGYVVKVADEDESMIIRFKCGLHLTRDTTLYFNKLIPNNLRLVYSLDEKKNINASVLHLRGRAGLYLESGHVILHIPSLDVDDTGYYQLDGNCNDRIFIKVQEADYVADEGESMVIRFKCGLHLTKDTTLYFNKYTPIHMKMVYLINEKQNINASIYHLQGRSGLYLDSGHMILHIPSLLISDAGYYEFFGNCIEIIRLKVRDSRCVVNVADEGESRMIRFKCGLHLTRDSTVYFSKLTRNIMKMVYLLDEKRNISVSVGHLEGRARLYLDSYHMILHIPSLQISDTGYYKFTGNCVSRILLKVQGKPVLKINGVDYGDKTYCPDDEIANISCVKEGHNSSIMKIKLNEDLPGTIEYLESKINTAHLKIVSLKASHKFTVDDIDKTLICSSDDSKLERKVYICNKVTAKLSISKVNSFKAGKEVTLTCTSTGRPVTELYWLKADTKLSGVNTNPTPDGKLMKIENHLKFTPSIEDNTKNLSCIAIDRSIKDVMTLDVTYVPVLTLSAEINEITGNSTIQFKCSVNANPLPSNIIWMKDDTIFSEGKTENIESLKYLLIIENVNRRHQGTYSCKAENPDGTRESTKIHLKVNSLCLISLEWQSPQPESDCSV